MNEQMDEEMNRWQAEELEGEGNRTGETEGPAQSHPFIHSDVYEHLTCAMYLCKVLGTHRHA